MSKKINPLQPENFDLECSTVWSFPRRGNWATHNSKYRGNWSPDVVRNLLLRYSRKWDTILDPMVGGGTTAIEGKLLGRKLIAFDINPNALEITKSLLEFETAEYKEDSETSSEWQDKIDLYLWDARELLKKIKKESVDFFLTHPPYADIIQYSDGKIPWDLSNIHDLEEFADEIKKIAEEVFRVLKPWKFCAVLMGDTRRKKMYQPLAFKVLKRFLDAGFDLKEDIVKVQHNCKATGYWKTSSQKYNFLLIMHEHLFIFQKPTG